MKTACLIILSVLLIVAATIPLNDLSLQNKPEGLSFLLLDWGKFNDLDIAVNIFLFGPFGFALGLLLTDRLRVRPCLRLVAVVFSGFGVSYLIEILQSFTSTRMASSFDVGANTAGAFLGLIWYSAYASKNVKLALCLYAASIFGISAILQHNTSLRNWDSSYPLILGNEGTGDRPWRGRIFELYISDRAIPQETVRTTGNTIISADNLLAVTRWKLAGDQSGITATRKEKRTLYEGITTDRGRWLESTGPVTSLTEKLRKSSQFTLVATVASENPNQNGPARIVSLSKDPDNRNFTLAQEGRDLVFRLRTPVTGENGVRPDLRIPAVFSTMERQSIWIVYDGSSLVAYVNGARRSAPYELTPGYVALTYLPIRLSLTDMRIYRVFYYLAAFVPMGVLIHLRSKSMKSTRGNVLIITFILFSSVALESILVGVSGKPIEYANVILGVVFSGSGVLLMAVRSKSLQPMNSLKQTA
jgi:glycopeptide antibiotics resistance protein